MVTSMAEPCKSPCKHTYIHICQPNAVSFILTPSEGILCSCPAASRSAVSPEAVRIGSMASRSSLDVEGDYELMRRSTMKE